MKTYKIKNITNNFNKRDINYNSTLNIDYINGMTKKTIKLKPDNEFYLKVLSLPVSIHLLRLKGLIIVEEVNDKKIDKLLNKKIKKNVSEKTEKKIKPTLPAKITKKKKRTINKIEK